MKYWQSAVFGMIAASMGVSQAFGAMSDCRNPVEVKIDESVKMRFCEVPEGNAAIGSNKKGASTNDERPVFTRSFKGFQIGQFTVTQEQYRAVLGQEPWKANGEPMDYVKEGENFPAVYVSYFQAKLFVRVMNLIDSTAQYRLPTEAEFEYAARAGTTADYFWGDEFDELSYAYYSETIKGGDLSARDVTTCPVPGLDKKFPGYCANGFGLMHMLGNVWQWTADAYATSYEGAPTNGNETVEGDDLSAFRAVRGGSWDCYIMDLRSSSRSYHRPDEQFADVGFRLVRIPK